MIAEPNTFDAFLATAKDNGATVRRVAETDTWAIHHRDSERINTLWILARAVGDVGAIFGFNRFFLARPFDGGF